MARVTSRDLKKGTTLQVVQSGLLYPPHFSLFNGNAGVLTLSVGDTFEVVGCAKGASSSMELHLKEIGGAHREGWQFLIQAGPLFKVLSQPEITTKLPRASERDPRLNEDEEFAIVLKSDPKQLFQQVIDGRFLAYGTQTPDMTLINKLFFTTKSGQRKRFKNMQTVGLHVREMSGAQHTNFWAAHFGPGGDRERAFHLHVLSDFSYPGDGPDPAALPEMELRKYNRDTRKLSSVTVDYDISGYIAKFRTTMTLLSLYGEAVSTLADELGQGDQLKDYPYVLSAYFDEKHFEHAFKVPREKDLYLDLALKQLGIKKKGVPLVNKNGFSAIAFATEAERDAFEAVYKMDPQKKMVRLEWAKLDPSVDLALIVDFYTRSEETRLQREVDEAISPLPLDPATTPSSFKVKP